MKQPYQLKLPAYQVAYLIKHWERKSIDEIVVHLNGVKPSPKATAKNVRSYAARINKVLPGVCTPRNDIR